MTNRVPPLPSVPPLERNTDNTTTCTYLRGSITTCKLVFRTCKIILSHFFLILKLVLPVWFFIISLLITLSYFLLPNPDDQSEWTRPKNHSLRLSRIAVQQLSIFIAIALCILMVGSSWINSLLVRMVALVYADEKPTYTNCHHRVLLNSLLGFFTNVTHLFIILPAFLSFIFPGVILSTSWLAQESFLVLERKCCWSALSSSWELTSEYRLPSTSLLFYILLTWILVQFGWGELLYHVLKYELPYVGYMYVGTLPSFFFWNFFICIKCVMYFNLKILKEQLGPRELCEQLGVDKDVGGDLDREMGKQVIRNQDTECDDESTIV